MSNRAATNRPGYVRNLPDVEWSPASGVTITADIYPAEESDAITPDSDQQVDPDSIEVSGHPLAVLRWLLTEGAAESYDDDKAEQAAHEQFQEQLCDELLAHYQP